MNYEPRWDLLLPLGEAAENSIVELLTRKLSLNGRVAVEVKRKSYADFKFYVETAQRPQGAADFKKSGLNITEADLWVFVIGDSGVTVVIETEALRRAARLAPEAEERDGDNPTKGRLVAETHLFQKRLREAA